jgi:hypothetical protein
MTEGKMKKLNILTKTKASTYILPCLGMNIFSQKENIVNAFIGDEDYPELDNHIFVLYKFQGTPEFLRFEDDLEDNPLYECTYDPMDEYVMKVFNVPEAYQKDYDTFKDSKYSELSMDLKTRIIAFHGLSPTHPVADVLYKREAAFIRLEAELNKYSHEGVTDIVVDRNLEASGKIDLSREIFSSRYKTEDPFVEERMKFLTKEGLQ